MKDFSCSQMLAQFCTVHTDFSEIFSFQIISFHVVAQNFPKKSLSAPITWTFLPTPWHRTPSALATPGPRLPALPWRHARCPRSFASPGGQFGRFAACFLMFFPWKPQKKKRRRRKFQEKSGLFRIQMDFKTREIDYSWGVLFVSDFTNYDIF